VTHLHIEFPPDLLEAIAVRAAALVLQRLDARLPDRPDEWMTTAEAAAYLRLTPAALRARVRRGTVSAYRDNGRWLFRRSELDAELVATMKLPTHPNGASAASTAPPPTPKECTFDA
jgi:excisionase family DNA binding protein